ncbi:MAG: hypothetical protein QXK88_01435 [Desulfurococcaceae archaeon]
MKIDACPRCGAPGYLIIDERELKSGTQVYYFVLHKYRDPATGKLRTKKCSIGSEGYIYVTKTHTLPYHGISLRLSNIVEAEKLAELAVKTLENIEKYLKRLSPEKREEEIKRLGPRIERLAEIIALLSELEPSLYPNLETLRRSPGRSPGDPSSTTSTMGEL